MAVSSHVKQTLSELIEKLAEDYGDQVAIKDKENVLTYRQLDCERKKVSCAILSLGIRKGDRVAIWAPNITEWIVAALGIQAVGVVLVPVDPALKSAEAGNILRCSGAKVLFTLSGFLTAELSEVLAEDELPELEHIIVFRGKKGEGLSWNEFLKRAGSVTLDKAAAFALSVDPDDPLDLIFTSGTTGRPKGVVTSHSKNICVCQAWADRAGLKAGDIYLIVNYFYHAFGFKAGWLPALINGARLIPALNYDTEEILQCIQDEKVTVIPGLPPVYQDLLACPNLGKYDISSLRLAVTGPSSVPSGLIRRMYSELGFETVITAYGLTESSGVASMCIPGDDEATLYATSGLPLEGVEIKSVDENGVDVGVNVMGEILIRGCNVMQEYFKDPAATMAAVDCDGWLYTGDVGLIDSKGYIHIADRIKDMFVVGGCNCYPAEIEDVISCLAGVVQVAVIGVYDESLGEVAKALVVRNPKAALLEEDVITICRERLPDYKVPRTVEFVDKLPLSVSGKVMKNKLRKFYVKVFAS